MSGRPQVFVQPCLTAVCVSGRVGSGRVGCCADSLRPVRKGRGRPEGERAVLSLQGPAVVSAPRTESRRSHDALPGVGVNVRVRFVVLGSQAEAGVARGTAGGRGRLPVEERRPACRPALGVSSGAGSRPAVRQVAALGKGAAVGGGEAVAASGTAPAGPARRPGGPATPRVPAKARSPAGPAEAERLAGPAWGRRRSRWNLEGALVPPRLGCPLCRGEGSRAPTRPCDRPACPSSRHWRPRSDLARAASRSRPAGCPARDLLTFSDRDLLETKR